MLKVGLTGGIGAGKTTASNYFSSLGVKIIDTDIIAAKLVKKGQPALNQIKQVFGDKVLLSDGQLNRHLLSQMIFHSPNAKKNLEAILHPLILQNTLDQIAVSTGCYCVIVVPLLFEANFDTIMDRILVIDSNKNLQIQRVVSRDEKTHKDVESIIQSQLDPQLRRDKADDIVFNNGNTQQLTLQLDVLHKKYHDICQNQL